MREASGIKELKGDSRSDTEDSTDGEALHGMVVSSGNPLKQWKAHKPMYVQVIMERQPIKMELDTGAAVSIMPYTMYKEKMAHIQLRKSTVNLKTYTGQRVRPLGEITVQVAKNGTVERLKLVVVDGLGPPLMGRNWLSRIPIDWGEIKVLRAGDKKQSRTLRLKRLLEKYPGIQKEQGTLKGTKAHLPLKEGATPVFLKARPVPYSLRTRVEKELERLEKGRIIVPVSTNEWATPVVVAPKKHGSIRLCGDLRMTVNQAIKVDKYPLPLIEDIFASQGGSTMFSKVDLRHAYLQMELKEQAKELCIVNTHKGLYRYNRLRFGVSSAPALWRRRRKDSRITR